ncbi:MAG: hypothetical protein AAB091_08155 [Elusimicrobiota bacterium]
MSLTLLYNEAVIPAEAGIQDFILQIKNWIPAFVPSGDGTVPSILIEGWDAGMTNVKGFLGHCTRLGKARVALVWAPDHG